MTDTRKEFEDLSGYSTNQLQRANNHSDLPNGTYIYDYVESSWQSWQACQQLNDKRIADLLALVAKKDEALRIFSCPVNAGYSSDNYYEQELDDIAEKALALTVDDVELDK